MLIAHPVVETDDRPLLDVAFCKQALACSRNPTLTDLELGQKLSYF